LNHELDSKTVDERVEQSYLLHLFVVFRVASAQQQKVIGLRDELSDSQHQRADKQQQQYHFSHRDTSLQGFSPNNTTKIGQYQLEIVDKSKR